MNAEHRRQVEALLERPLHDDELVRGGGTLNQRQHAVAAYLRHRQLVLCALYLIACGVKSPSRWISDNEP